MFLFADVVKYSNSEEDKLRTWVGKKSMTLAANGCIYSY